MADNSPPAPQSGGLPHPSGVGPPQTGRFGESGTKGAPKRSSGLRIASFSFSRFTVHSPLAFLCWLALASMWTDGPIGNKNAVLFFGFTVLASAVYWGFAVSTLIKYWYYLLFPVFCAITYFWSDDPGLSLRWGFELFVTCFGGLLIGRVLSVWTVLRTIFFCSLIIVLLCVPFAPTAYRNHSALRGIFESKNILGFAAHTLFTSALVIFLWERRSVALRLLALPSLALALGMLALAQSAGATVSLAVSTAVVGAGSIYLATPRRFRLLFILAFGLAAASLLLIYPLLADFWKDVQQNVLHKDATLTGRTYLWEFAGRLIEERPWLGHGANAFWRQGNVDAEGLWERYQIESRHGFSFHNTFIETAVGTGYIGLLLYLSLVVFIGGRILVNFVRRPSTGALFLIAYFAAFYLRMPTEVVVGPFDGPIILLLAAAVFKPEPAAADARTPRRRSQPPRPWTQEARALASASPLPQGLLPARRTDL